MLWKTCLLGPILPLYVVVAGTGRHREDQPCDAPSAGPTRTAWSTPGRPRTAGRSVADVPARSAVDASPPLSGSRRHPCSCSSGTVPGSSSSSASWSPAYRKPARTGPSPWTQSYASPVTSWRRSGPAANARSRARRSASSSSTPSASSTRSPTCGSPASTRTSRTQPTSSASWRTSAPSARPPPRSPVPTPTQPDHRSRRPPPAPGGRGWGPGGGSHDREKAVVELAARTLALWNRDRELLPGLEPAADVVGLDQPVHHRARVAARRDLARDRPEGVPRLHHIGDLGRRPIRPDAPGQSRRDQEDHGHDEHDAERPGERSAAPREPHTADLLLCQLTRDWEHLFDHAFILPEHVFAVNRIHNIELVFASAQRRC